MENKKVKIKDVVKLINGYPFKPTDRDDLGVNIIRIQNLNNPLAIYNKTAKKVDDKYIVKKGDILISWSASLGVYEWKNDDSYLNQHIFKIEFISERILKDYFRYVIKLALEELTYKMRGVGLKHLTKGQLDEYEFALPNLEEQEEIINRLKNIESLILKRKKSIILLDEFIKSLFLQMFGHPIPNHKNWEKNKITKYCKSIVPGRNKPSVFDGAIPWIKTENLRELSFIDTSTNYLLSESEIKISKNKIIPKGSVVMTSAGKVGTVSIANSEIVLNQQLHCFVCKEKILPEFLLFVIFFQKRVVENLAMKAVISYLNKSKCESIDVIAPDLKLQKKFVDSFYKVDLKKQQIDKSLELLEELFQSFLYNSFAQNEIKEDEIDILMNDELEIETIIQDIKVADFESIAQYNISKDLLFRILERTEEKRQLENGSSKFNKGIVQIYSKNKIEIKTNREHKLDSK
ncbi:restriction endonuclease subunit S [Flavobacterium sp. GSB-24]|uniref:restriction endonuclease subunit S n=1 Tax=Flavobacterium sp. GSB-24 TaxID=2994319 RepID=UPI00248FF334|nr:restriction endonuclease subunit S [Flavobacterium sp. GSB-24]BDU27228.1 hypothetical protein FLGSB24_39720 [Flavobacterium sp. GSB-24]